MKQAITYLLFFTYSTTMFKPILPYASDIVAHALWYSDHIATIHSHDGKFHVHKEVIEAAKNNNHEKTNIPKKDNSASDHIRTPELTILRQKNFSKKNYSSIHPGFFYTYLLTDFPPPKVLAHTFI